MAMYHGAGCTNHSSRRCGKLISLSQFLNNYWLRNRDPAQHSQASLPGDSWERCPSPKEEKRNEIAPLLLVCLFVCLLYFIRIQPLDVRPGTAAAIV